MAPPEPDPGALGSAAFRHDYRVRYAYLAGSMYRGIASTELVIRLGRAGLLGFFGAGGLRPSEVAAALDEIVTALGPDGGFGMNLLHTPDDPEWEAAVVDLYLERGVRYVEAAAYARVTRPLVRYRCTGAFRDAAGDAHAVHHVVAKVSRPEVAEAFARPAPAALLERLVTDGELTAAEAEAARTLPMSEDICVEADSGGHTDGGVALTLLPSIRRLCAEVGRECRYPRALRVGAAGGLGTPEAVAAAFVLGADFVLTGSVNQCSPQAGTSAAVKDLLARMDVQDTAYAPAGDLFEIGARVQVARNGTLFAAHANRMHQIYRHYDGLAELDAETRRALERDCFGQPLEHVWQEVSARLAVRSPAVLQRAERDQKRRMALVLRWYFGHATELALRGDAAQQVNFQIHCGPAMGAFNRWVSGTELADWRARHVDVIADWLMQAAARHLHDRLRPLSAAAPPSVPERLLNTERPRAPDVP